MISYWAGHHKKFNFRPRVSEWFLKLIKSRQIDFLFVMVLPVVAMATSWRSASSVRPAIQPALLVRAASKPSQSDPYFFLGAIGANLFEIVILVS